MIEFIRNVLKIKNTIYLLLLFNCIYLFGGNSTELFEFKTDKSFGMDKVFIHTNDINHINWEILDTVANNINANSKRNFYTHYYGNYSFFYIDHTNKVEQIGTFNIHNTNTISLLSLSEFDIIDSNLSIDSPIYTFGIKMNKGKENFAFNVFLLSAYLQEKYPEYKNNDLIFTDFKEKNHNDFFKKTLITPGLGYSYLANENPVNRGGLKLSSFLLYLVDGFSMIPAFGGPFMGETIDDKVAISSIGIGMMASWRLLAYLFGKKELKEYNNLANSSYRIPNYMIRD